MKKRILLTAFLGFNMILILFRPSLAFQLASEGLQCWYSKTLPALLPFMIFSGLFVHTGGAKIISSFLSPITAKLYNIDNEGSFAILIGFLCGFPLGAKTISDLYASNKLTQEDAGYLLAFCNNIGPVFLIGYVFPLLNISSNQRYTFRTCLFGIYGIPLCYGWVLNKLKRKFHKEQSISYSLSNQATIQKSFPEVLDSTLQNAIESIVKLGGYMIFFSLLNMLPFMICQSSVSTIWPILEITGGITKIHPQKRIFALSVLSFGGLSCLAQTYSVLRNGNLEQYFKCYVKHKINLFSISLLYFLLLTKLHIL